ncbi:NERD domain-containing protein [Bacillus sp. Bva_UNVM-123]|uniref:nuclease-related domain-containing protein n=1 Tax=Bacillus sp. Bva_UNVM-123 TaxID=2829798 RepID=UPI00391F2F8F
MIAKERIVPLRLLKMEALLKRLPQNYANRSLIEQELAKRKAGYAGEKASDYYVNRLPDKEFTIFHDLRLRNGGHFFQLDTLIISSTFALILEIKNIKGTLYFDSTFKQLLRMNDSNEEGFLDPLSQAQQQKNAFRKWLNSMEISIPIDYLVVISNPSTIIKTNEHNFEALKRVTHAHNIFDKIAHIQKKLNKEVLSFKEITKIKRHLLKKHIHQQINILEFYKIRQEDIFTGVQCRNCCALPMKRQHGTWYCTICQLKDRTAHQQALIDYLLLFDSPISNQKFRNFLQLSSENIAKKLLRSTNLPNSGSNKRRIYHLSPLLQEYKNNLTEI